MMTIRRMTKEDIPGVLAVEEASFSTPWKRADFEATLLLPYAHFLVAVLDDEEDPGMGLYGEVRETVSPENREERIVGVCGLKNIVGTGEISNVGVLPAYRGRGIGKALLAMALHTGKEVGAEEFTLEVRAGNRPAIRLYERFGFRQEGIRKGFYEAPREDALIYWKRKASEKETND